jgi:hypothetical protein
LTFLGVFFTLAVGLKKLGLQKHKDQRNNQK